MMPQLFSLLSLSVTKFLRAQRFSLLIRIGFCVRNGCVTRYGAVYVIDTTIITIKCCRSNRGGRKREEKKRHCCGCYHAPVTRPITIRTLRVKLTAARNYFRYDLILTEIIIIFIHKRGRSETANCFLSFALPAY